ncbi:uncharacterized protein [Lolium perenne]|uniref:uncharacterized protein isoform X2 n=1 Tax=Lolium perenne TaxID=4522 RepID=UPI0021F5BFFB|nr:uncharacterized protein LOC127323832 isoform X2 [Lolium perenne]
MATELVPVVDLRALSQPDLDALAAASAHAVAPGTCPDAGPLPPLNIDRAVFNESAGSRKQTFSRHRLATAASSSAALPTSPAPSAGNDPENHLIAHHLRRLFARDGPARPPPSSSPPPPQTLAVREPSPPPPPSPDPDRETRNSKGVSVDLVRLAGLEDPYGEELQRRTAGLMSEHELMGFITGLEGKWVSQRHRRKFVDAAFFGDHLPSGWNLLLGLKRKHNQVWVHCLQYVSPRGHQFGTCREVSVHLMSLLGYPEAITLPIQHNSPKHLRDDDGHDDGHDDGPDDGHEDAHDDQQVHSSVDNQNALPVTAVNVSSHSGNSNDDKEDGNRNPANTNQNALPVTAVNFSSHSGNSNDDKEDGNRNPANTYQCEKCNLTLHDQSAYDQHQLLFHKKKRGKRRKRSSKYGEPIVGKDGKFECPVCHKNFEEQSRYFGHVGAHARYEGLTPEAFLDKILSGKAVNYPVGELQFTLQDLSESTEPNVKTPSEAASLHQNYSKEQGLDRSKVKELFGINCSDSFNKPNEALCRPEEVTPVTDARSACKYGNDMMDYAAVTIPKVAPQSNDQLNGGINGFAVFGNQAGSYHAFRPTTFASANHCYEDQIGDRSLPSSKHVEFSNTMKARDVNLNSRLDTISFPIAGVNNETSTALDEANQSSITGKCFSASLNNNDGASTTSSCSGSNNKVPGSLGMSTGSSNAARCISASYGNDSVANIFGNKNSTMAYPSNMNMRPISPVVTNVDSFASRSDHSKNSDKERASNTKERMNITQHRTRNEAAFGIEGYGTDVYTGDVTERSLAQFSNNLSHLKPNIPSSCALPESNTLTASNFMKGTHVQCINGSFIYTSDANNMEGSFVNKSISNNEPKGSAHDVMGKPSNNMQNFYNGTAPNCTPPAVNTSQNVNGVVSMQGNFGYMSTLVHSVGDVPRSSTTQDQCDLQLGFGGQKQHIFPGYGELRSAASGSPQLGGMARNNNLPTGSSQFGNMVRPNSLPVGSSQVGSLASSNYVQSGSSQIGRMAGPNSTPPAESSQFRRMAGPDTRPPADSSQFLHTSGSNSRPPAESQFGRVSRPNPVPAGESSLFRRMTGPDSGPPAESSQLWHMSAPNSRPPAESSQFGRIAGPNPVPPSESSQSRSMARQNFVRTSEPTLVLGNAPQMGSGPPVQSGWDLNLSRMVGGGGMIAALCVWCNSQFHHFGSVDGQQADNYGLICPSCKERVAAQRNMPNNGSWQP